MSALCGTSSSCSPVPPCQGQNPSWQPCLALPVLLVPSEASRPADSLLPCPDSNMPQSTLRAEFVPPMALPPHFTQFLLPGSVWGCHWVSVGLSLGPALHKPELCVLNPNPSYSLPAPSPALGAPARAGAGCVGAPEPAHTQLDPVFQRGSSLMDSASLHPSSFPV